MKPTISAIAIYSKYGPTNQLILARRQVVLNQSEARIFLLARLLTEEKVKIIPFPLHERTKTKIKDLKKLKAQKNIPEKIEKKIETAHQNLGSYYLRNSSASEFSKKYAGN